MRTLADGLGIRVATAGAVVPSVGLDEFIQQDIVGRVHQLTHDLAALAVFTARDRPCAPRPRLYADTTIDPIPQPSTGPCELAS